MKECLLNLLNKESESLKKLIQLVQEHNKRIVGNDTYLIEEIIKEIRIANKDVATLEVERLKLLDGKKISDVIRDSNCDDLDKAYGEMKNIILKVQSLNKTSEILIKQRIRCNSKVIELLTPLDEEYGVYDCFGKIRS